MVVVARGVSPLPARARVDVGASGADARALRRRRSRRWAPRSRRERDDDPAHAARSRGACARRRRDAAARWPRATRIAPRSSTSSTTPAAWSTSSSPCSTWCSRIAHDHPPLTRNVGNIALLRDRRRLRARSRAASPPPRRDAYRDYRRLQHQIRLTGAPHARVDPDSQAARRARRLGAVDTASSARRGTGPASRRPHGAAGRNRLKSPLSQSAGRRRHVDGRPRRMDLVRRQDGAVARRHHPRAHAHAALRHGRLRGRARYKTVDGPAIFRLRDHTDRLFRSAHIFGMKIPFTQGRDRRRAARLRARQQARSRATCGRSSFYGSEAMGVAAKSNPVLVAIAAWPWGAYLGAEASRRASASRRRRSRTIIRTSRCATRRRCAITPCRSSPTRRRRTTATRRRCCSIRRASSARARARTCSSSATASCTRPIFRGGALNGITRDTIITFASELGIPVLERRITRDEVYIADEAFFTGTAAEVTPIRELDNRPIGAGTRGPITTKLQTLVLRHGQRPQPGEEIVADQGVTMTETIQRPAGGRGDARGPAGVLPESGDAAVVDRIRASFSTSRTPARRCARIAARDTCSSADR